MRASTGGPRAASASFVSAINDCSRERSRELWHGAAERRPARESSGAFPAGGKKSGYGYAAVRDRDLVTLAHLVDQGSQALSGLSDASFSHGGMVLHVAHARKDYLRCGGRDHCTAHRVDMWRAFISAAVALATSAFGGWRLAP